MTTENEEYLTDELARVQQENTFLRQRLHHARETVEADEDIIHKAGKIARHIPALCESLQEPSWELMQAAMQLQAILERRES